MEKKSMFQPIIKWSGSKRSQAMSIISYFPEYDTYYEPFLGGGSVLYALNPNKSVASDVCEPLIELWNIVKNEPQLLFEKYSEHWSNLQREGHLYYYDVRKNFNQNKNGIDLFFFIENLCKWAN